MAAKKKSPKKPQERNLTRELAALLAKTLLPDLEARAKEPSVARALEAQYESEKKHTADKLAEWITRTLEQVAVAWILSCVFIRTLEDRGYLTHPRLAGEGADDSEHLFFDLFPSLTQRDYLLAVFRELSHLPGGEDVLGPQRNPAWRLAPSTETVRALLAFFREADDGGQLVWTFAGDSTRFLGDLYQDVSEAVRERYALLQTPEFVEEFILHLTLDPAITEFGLEHVRVLDPTCGSGHFLLGAFNQLFEERQRKAPGVPAKEHAASALAQVYGADINPYAAAIARFRLVLAYLRAAEIDKLKNAPRISTNVVVTDSLRFAANKQTLPFAAVAEDATAWGEGSWQLEDPKEAQRIFAKNFHAVVGNPPYITCKDAKLREYYRRLYPKSCQRSFALSAPFTERFFVLAVEGGFVGMINANSFIKREFGVGLIEKVLPNFELTRVMDTASADIPGHKTPTVLLFGRRRTPVSDDVCAVLGKRASPGTSQVWLSIRDHFDEPGFENDFISVARLPRDSLKRHPWSLGGGGTGSLKEYLEQKGACRLSELIDGSIGRAARVGCDEVFVLPPHVAARIGTPSCWRDLVVGEVVRDWGTGEFERIFFPYDERDQLRCRNEEDAGLADALRLLWPFRSTLKQRVTFQGVMHDAGLRWYEYMQYTPSANATPMSIVFAFVATHNHFVLDRGGRVFKQSSPIIKLPANASEDEHLVLLAYLNSSTACFWMKQVFQAKSSESNSDHPDAERNRYEHAGTQMSELPVPAIDANRQRLAELAREALALAQQRRSTLQSARTPESWATTDLLRERMIAVQEEIDWTIYAAFGLAPQPDSAWKVGSTCPRGDRPFERLIPRKSFVRRKNESLALNVAEAPAASRLSEHLESTWAFRSDLISKSQQLQLIETQMYKRVWRDTDDNIDEPTFRARFDEQAEMTVRCTELEHQVRTSSQPLTLRQLDRLGTASRDGIMATLMTNAVPFLSGHRYSEAGLVKRAEWERVWDLQRREDAGQRVVVPAPPKYDPVDFRDPIFWRLRGKLDVSKERFISYPGAEKDDDKSPLFGWAGWDHLQQATALAGLYHERKTEDGWPADRLVPLLAGLLELVPWLKQWHNVPSDELGGEGPGDWYERYVEAESRSLGKSLQDLRDWRPATGRKKANSP